MIRNIHVAILVLTIGCITARPSKKDAFGPPRAPGLDVDSIVDHARAPGLDVDSIVDHPRAHGLDVDSIVDHRHRPIGPVKETTYREKKEFTGVPQNPLDGAAGPVHERIGDRKKESKQARMLPYVAIGYGKRSAEAAGLNRTINPPPYYGKRSAEAAGPPAAPVAYVAYPFREARQIENRYYPQHPLASEI